MNQKEISKSFDRHQQTSAFGNNDLLEHISQMNRHGSNFQMRSGSPMDSIGSKLVAQNIISNNIYTHASVPQNLNSMLTPHSLPAIVPSAQHPNDLSQAHVTSLFNCIQSLQQQISSLNSQLIQNNS